jgi:hypothetical protein
MTLLPILLRWVPATFVATAVAAGAALFTTVDRRLTLQVYVLVVGALVLLTVVAVFALAARDEPSPFVHALRRRPPRPARPEELQRLERQVALAVENVFDFHFRLRPTLVAAAEAAVWRRHGVPLERAEAYLDAGLWEFVRPDAPPPRDRLAPGPPLDRLNSAVAALERISR